MGRQTTLERLYVVKVQDEKGDIIWMSHPISYRNAMRCAAAEAAKGHKYVSFDISHDTNVDVNSEWK